MQSTPEGCRHELMRSCFLFSNGFGHLRLNVPSVLENCLSVPAPAGVTSGTVSRVPPCAGTPQGQSPVQRDIQHRETNELGHCKRQFQCRLLAVHFVRIPTHAGASATTTIGTSILVLTQRRSRDRNFVGRLSSLNLLHRPGSLDDRASADPIPHMRLTLLPWSRFYMLPNAASYTTLV